MTVSDPADLPPSDAVERFLDARRIEATDATVRSYRHRLDAFVRWTEANGIDRMADLSGWYIDRFRESLSSRDLAPTTVKGHMVAVNQLIEYCARIDVVDGELTEKVHIPAVSTDDETSDKKLAADDATALLEFYRHSRADYGVAKHTLLEVVWNTGGRIGGIRALDLGDYDAEEQYLDFEHRPDTDTPLKNKRDGERTVSLPETVCEVLDVYIARERDEKRDDHGRNPLFGCRQGRPSLTTLRNWMYLATQPCIYGHCPHDERRETCNYRRRNEASKCPSSRSPHQVRTGSITWQLNNGVPLDVVAERVNASPAVIERFYDKAGKREKMEQRRRQYTEDLDVETGVDQ